MSVDFEGLEEVTDVDAWSQEALTIAAISEKNFELFMSFITSLGELAARRAGYNLIPLEER